LADNYSLQDFITECGDCFTRSNVPADCVTAIAPLMQRLVAGPKDFLQPGHFRSNPEHYARNEIFVADDECLSLYALVWRPGQWTPVHDHGTWGVVGVVRGILEERNYVRTDSHDERMSDITLLRGGVLLLAAGAITSFVPNPDHIHVTGVADDREEVVSLHLYGREMSGFNVYDADAGTRRFIDLPPQKS
jgi:predicted metal-dependent enzyme (double-stranded beta helix superfamily)